MKPTQFIIQKLAVAIELFNKKNDKAQFILKPIFKQYKMGKRDRKILSDFFFFYLKNKITVEDFAKNNNLNFANATVELSLKNNELSGDFPQFIIEKSLENFKYFPQNWLNQKAKPQIRVNTKKISRENLQKQLKILEIETNFTPISPFGLIVLKNEQKLSQTNLFKNGFFEMQDESSQIVSTLGKIATNSILDACAGGGGKSIALATIFPKLKIFATDTREHLFKEIQKRAKKNGVKIKTVPQKSIKKIKVDTVFIDAPCTGSGVLRRNPEDRWRITKNLVKEKQKLQQICLETYKNNLKEKGHIIYITCSFFKEENEQTIETFLKRNKNFELLDINNILEENSSEIQTDKFLKIKPQNERDLFFAAILRKK